MWTLPRSDLKVRLTVRIVAVAAFCFAAAAAYVLWDAAAAARARLDGAAAVAARGLELQQKVGDWVTGQPFPFPDLQTIAAPLMAPGRCIGFRAAGGAIAPRFCAGTQGDEGAPPAAFAALYRHMFDPGREAVHAVRAHGRTVGEVVVWAAPASLAAAAWGEASHLLAVMAAMLPLLSALVYGALARALRPTRAIRSGLERIAAGDLTARLPPFDLAELSAVGAVFNQLAAALERTLAERRALSRRLVALEDDERRHLARELHDEFGQSLVAIRALAASAAQAAAQDCPSLLSECESIGRAATQMMGSLRGTLFRLRPPDVDELGLAASLEGLVAGWNGRSHGRMRCEINVADGLDGVVPPSIATALYRIAQEALTNAAKHAEASRVVLALALRHGDGTPGGAAPGETDPMEVELAVADDGRARGGEPMGKLGGKPGMGFLGMRERVAALGGRLRFEPGAAGGSVLRVAIPLTSPAGERGSACAA